MKIQIRVELDITFCDDDLGDPASGDPLETRFQESAREAVEEALTHGMNRGFNHDLSDLTSIYVSQVTVVR